MAVKRLAVFDPSGRLLADLAHAADASRVQLIPFTKDVPPGCAAILVAPLVAADMGPPAVDSAPRWIVGDGSNAARVALSS